MNRNRVLLITFALQALSVFAAEEVSFIASGDGSVQKYVIVHPKEMDPNRPRTMLIALHGHGSDRWQFVRQPRAECRAVRDVAKAYGLLLVSPDYRAKTSWMGPKAEADMVQLINALKKQCKLEKIIVVGGSMGGTGALTFAALHPTLVDGVVALNGTADLVHYPHFGDAITKSFGGTRKEVPDQYRRRSALFFHKKFIMPLAATTGGRDTTVPPDSTLKLLAKVKEHNPNVLGIHRPKGGHSTNYADTKKALEFVVGKTSPIKKK
jgi:pimeloyl-ACP methyl ester carboxylesterase